jgi:hypothetical protein
MNTIPYETAAEICEQTSQVNHRKPYTFNGMWCLGCTTFSKGIEQRCFNNAPGCRGCAQVNQKFDLMNSIVEAKSS